jgi:phosphatidylglycerophosphate synthase
LIVHLFCCIGRVFFRPIFVRGICLFWLERFVSLNQKIPFVFFNNYILLNDSYLGNFMETEKMLRKVFHPNRITAYGAGMTAAGLGLVMGGASTDIYGVGLILAGNVMDGVDGYVARKYDMRTREGAKVDSLTDKLKNFIIGGYIVGCEVARGDVVLPVSMGVNFVVDAVSTKQRGDLVEQVEEACMAVYDVESCHKDVDAQSSVRANYWGKTKAVMQMGVGLAYVGGQVVQNHLGEFSDSVNDNISYGLSAALLTSAVCGGVGIWKRVQKGREKVEREEKGTTTPPNFDT